MATLRKFDLSKDDKKGDWVLVEEGKSRARRRFPTKSAATGKGVLEDALGPKGGSVRIHKEDGKFQQERTFPTAADPRNSKG